MVQETVLVGIVGVGGTLLGAVTTGIFNWISTNQRIRADRENLKIREQNQTDRQRGEYYLEKKVDALMDLYAVLEETRREYKRLADQAGYGGISQEEYSNVIDRYYEYKRATDRAAVFLSEGEHETLLQVFSFIHDLNSYLKRSIDNSDATEYSEFDLAEYNNRFNEAEEVLKKELNGPIEALKVDGSTEPH